MFYRNKEETIKAIKIVKKYIKEKHDEFHNRNLRDLGLENYNDVPLKVFIKYIMMLDIQSRPNTLSKIQVYRLFEDFEKKYKEEKIVGKKPKEIVDYFYKLFLDINNIGEKIAYLITKNIIFIGDTITYFGYEKEAFMKYLLPPIDVHIRKLLTYRLELIEEKYFNRINSNNKKFLKETKEILDGTDNVYPVDLEYLWYIGYFYCNRRVICNLCPLYMDNNGLSKDSKFKKETDNRYNDLLVKYNKEKRMNEKEKINKQIKQIRKDQADINNYNGFINLDAL